MKLENVEVKILDIVKGNTTSSKVGIITEWERPVTVLENQRLCRYSKGTECYGILIQLSKAGRK